jgi:allophanate hydrolase subunit 2
VDQAPPQQPGNTLTILPGPRTDWFSPAAWRNLVGDSWTVTPDCDRVAVRLAGPPLNRSRTDELPSEGLLRGAVQVPSSGQPLIFLSDHPVTGGYPVIAILTDQACDTAAQLRPGDVVVFKRRPSRRAAGSSPRWMPGQPGLDR